MLRITFSSSSLFTKHIKSWKRSIVLALVLLVVLSQLLSFKPGQTNKRIEEGTTAYRNESSACAWNTSKTATWTNNTAEENDLLWKVQACHRRLYPVRQEQWDPALRQLPSSLRCNDRIMDDFKSILFSYDNIIFMGDSLIRQQFFTLLCTINPSMERSNISFPLEPTATRLTVYSKMEYSYHDPQNVTSMVSVNYYEGNQRIHKNQIFLNLTGATATPRDVLVVNQGAWYQPDALSSLQQAANGILERAQVTNATLLYMETVNFEWPSSNGEHVKGCFYCNCEALTPERIRGNGNYTGPAQFLVLESGGHGLRDVAMRQFQPLYPDLLMRNHSVCIPHCLPANWRNDVTNSILSQSVTIVPIWKQLVSFGHPQNRQHGDCTHKSTDALLAMNQQLLRSMKIRAREF